MKKRDNTGKFIKTAKYVTRNCENCNIEFQIKESRLKYGGGKCCSRKCTDENKKKTYKGENNPMYGVIHTEERKNEISKISSELWKQDKFRNKVKKGHDIFFERAAEDGTWDRANEKRIKTMIKKYGKHNLSGNYGERDCDKTFEKKYGMTSVQYRSKFNKTKRNTNIEIIVQKLLDKNNIEYQKHYIVEGYEYDIYLPNENILIECDGDYWHGFNLKDKELNETQINVRNNDKIKNNIAKDKNIKLIRFWGSEIKNKKFELRLLDKIYGK